MQLILVRHAQTDSNVLRALDTAHPGADLTDMGRQQVDALARLLSSEPVDGVWCSPRLRARRTAQGVASAHGLAPTSDERLAEIGAGAVEMSTDKADALAYRDAVAGWMRGDLSPRMPGGETGTEVLARMDGAIGDVVAAGTEHAVVVSHGAVVRFWCALRVPDIGLDLARMALGNTGLVRLHGDGRIWRCSEWDSVAVEPGGAAGPASEAI